MEKSGTQTYVVYTNRGIIIQNNSKQQKEIKNAKNTIS
jgi:hypothetical protein